MKMKRILVIPVAIMVIVSAYIIILGFASWQKQYTWDEMDWDNNGSTTLSEFFQASDIGVREKVKDGNKCMEFYAYKDGRPVKVVCK